MKIEKYWLPFEYSLPCALTWNIEEIRWQKMWSYRLSALRVDSLIWLRLVLKQEGHDERVERHCIIKHIIRINSRKNMVGKLAGIANT